MTRDIDRVRNTLDDYTTDDASMRSCLGLARAAARTDLPILILGETGTGKTLIARAIHNSSARSSYSFVSFNAAALSETLVDSQLFGHERGAFTGADKRVRGKFELAHQGTLFIDEIADMSPAAQAKILRAVEYGEFERLGSEVLQVALVRLVSATHLPLKRYVRSEHFRQDLFYRISGITINLPPLRERPNDLRALVAAEITAASRDQRKSIRALSRSAADRLFAHAWPGNLRELKRVIQTAVALTEGDTIFPDALFLDALDALADASSPRESTDRRHATSGQRVGADHPALPPRPRLSDERSLRLADVEQRHIDFVLQLTGGNKRRAARLLGLSRSTLDRKLAEPLATPTIPALPTPTEPTTRARA